MNTMRGMIAGAAALVLLLTPCRAEASEILPAFSRYVHGYVWTTDAGNSAANAIALDSQGNLVVAGHLASFNPDEQTTALIVKYDQSGTRFWSEQWEEGPIDPDLLPNEHGKWSSADIYRAVAVDAADNIYAAGQVSGDWAGYTNDSWIHAMWLRRFDTDGNLVWDHRYHDTIDSAWQWWSGLDTDPAGNVYVAGPSMGAWGGVEYRWTTVVYDGAGDIVTGPVQHNASPYFYLQDHAYDVAALGDGGFVTVGRIGVSGEDGSPTRDYDWHVRFSGSDGRLLRSDTYNHALLEDAALGVCVAEGTAVFVVGFVNRGTDNAEGIDRDARVCRYTLDGVAELNWTVGAAGTQEAYHDVASDGQGYIYAAGYREGVDGRNLGVITRYEVTSGIPVAEQTYPDLAAVYDIDIRDGQIALAGAEYGEVEGKLNFYAQIADLLPQPAEGEGEGEGEGECDPWCVDLTADTDGDGITDCNECSVVGTDPGQADTDGDGMPDGYEVDYDLFPLYASGDFDTDEDGLTDLEEYLRGSDPLDPNSPDTVHYVSNLGADLPSAGTYANPWASVGYALGQVAPTASNPVRIVVFPGTYAGNLALRPYVTLAGVPEAPATLQGAITGAGQAALRDLVLAPPASAPDTVLLTVDDVAMRVSNVRFQGTLTRQATGILTRGAGSAGTVIEGCAFVSLARGLVIEGAIPVIRRTRFTDIAQVGIQVQPWTAKIEDNTLSSADDASRGWNSFDLAGGALAVENNRGEQLVMENTDWGVDTPAEIEALIGGSGTVDYEPYLEKGAAAAVSSLLCTVWDAATQARVLDASVALVPSPLRDVTENDRGVYAFPAVKAGAYTVEVSAPGYALAGQAVLLPEGGAATVAVALSEGETPTPPGTCAPARDGITARTAADTWLLLAVAAVLLAAARRRTRTQSD